jgi:CubicO group peptidase (beta-lactamase class C family)
MIVTDWQARHGLNAADYQHTFDALVSQGYRLVKVSGYAVHDQARYAGIWYRRGGNAWQARHGISEADYQQAVTDLGAQGYRLTHVSVFSLGSRTLFSAVWEQEKGLIWIARHNLTSAEYQRLFDDLSRRGYRLRCVSGYEVGAEARYACIWDLYAGPAWQARHGLDGQTYQHEFDTLVAQGYRLVQVVGYPIQGTPRYAAVWEQSPGHSWQARHGIPGSQYQAEFDSMVRQGFRLADVSGYGIGSSAEYTTIWEDAAADQPEADPVSQLVIPFMQKWAVPGLSLAVARQGALKSSRCFGYANLITREIVTPQHRFRIASVTKPITSTAIFQLIEQGRLNLNDKVFGAGAILGTQFGTLPYGFGIQDITVQHLLTHTAGGWTNDANDPMFQRPDLNQHDLISWTLDNQPLLHSPGTFWLYSNFGYCLLGRVIEAITGMTYAAYVRQQVLGPCGVTAMAIAGNTALDRQPFEAMYVGKDLDAPYELLVSRMDSHGGWIATPDDLLRFLLRVDSFPVPPDLLGAATIIEMVTPTAINPGYAKGWAVNSAGTRWHDGTLVGTQSILVRVANQHEWCAICNTGKPFTGLALELDQLMWKVDAAT